LVAFSTLPGFWISGPVQAQNLDQPAPLAVAPATTISARVKSERVITTTTLMEASLGRRMELYRQAGISAAKLPRLELLHRDLFAARLNSETTRSAEINRRLGEFLTQEEQEAFGTAVRRSAQMLREDLAKRRTGSTTASLGMPPPTVAPAGAPADTVQPGSSRRGSSRNSGT
jgi:hypothetical protein